MKNQVLSIEQMQKLEELGVDISKASMCWIGCADANDVYPYNSTFKDIFENQKETLPSVLTPTFTLQDILEILPKNSLYSNKHIFVLYLLNDDFSILQEKSGKTPIEAAFNMLKWSKQNNYI